MGGLKKYIIFIVIIYLYYYALHNKPTYSNHIVLNYWLHNKLYYYLEDSLHKKIIKQSNLIKWLKIKNNK